ncbi:MAG: LysR family transcriptional regulator [Pseudolabrys sp.]|jgi:DNA-binding transcriptional LysR family regulator
MSREPRRSARISQRVSMSDLEILYAVSQFGSMAKAAAELRISQPAISRAVAEMETTLGVRLLDRSRRGVVPTLYGDALARRANAVLDEVKHGIKEIEFLSDPTAGELYIGSPEPLTDALLPEVVQRFWRQYPRVLIDIIPSLAGNFENLRARKIDFQVNRLLPGFSGDDILVEPLFDERIFIVAGLRNPWARRNKIKLADLADEKWIVQNNAFDSVAYAFQMRKLPVPRATVAAYSAFLRNQLTANGDFLAILAAPQLLVLRNQGLKVKVLPVDLSDLKIKIAIFQLKNRTLSPVSRLFQQYIREACLSGKFANAL